MCKWGTHPIKLGSSASGNLEVSDFPDLEGPCTPHQLWEATIIPFPSPPSALPASRADLQTPASVGAHGRIRAARTLPGRLDPKDPKASLSWLPIAHTANPHGDHSLDSSLGRSGLCLLSQIFFVLPAFPPIYNQPILLFASPLDYKPPKTEVLDSCV